MKLKIIKRFRPKSSSSGKTCDRQEAIDKMKTLFQWIHANYYKLLLSVSAQWPRLIANTDDKGVLSMAKTLTPEKRQQWTMKAYGFVGLYVHNYIN